MAKRGRNANVNKSQAIREFMAKNPDSTPKTIREGLLEQGVDASVGLISAVKYGGKNASNGGSRRVRRVIRRGRGRSSGAGITSDDLIRAKQFAEEIGGIANARQALELLEQLA